MLVVSRQPRESVYIGGRDVSCVVTVMNLHHDRLAVGVLITRSAASAPGQLDPCTVELKRDVAYRVGGGIEVVLIDVRGDKARLGINAPKEASVHRLEVYEAIRRENRRAREEGDNPDAGAAGSRVPRPGDPTPPSLDVRLDEPRDPED